MEPMLTMALRAARKAGEIIERAVERVDLLNIEEKGRNDYVSEIDKKAEQEIMYHLKPAVAQIPAIICGSSTRWMAPPISYTAFRIFPFPSPVPTRVFSPTQWCMTQ
jgi:3'-phosphoadenosine 5'-phosphosulfate (PAPS) 3'-phosphatase